MKKPAAHLRIFPKGLVNPASQLASHPSIFHPFVHPIHPVPHPWFIIFCDLSGCMVKVLLAGVFESGRSVLYFDFMYKLVANSL
jgi:hypothetical protein